MSLDKDLWSYISCRDIIFKAHFVSLLWTAVMDEVTLQKAYLRWDETRNDTLVHITWEELISPSFLLLWKFEVFPLGLGLGPSNQDLIWNSENTSFSKGIKACSGRTHGTKKIDHGAHFDRRENLVKVKVTYCHGLVKG